MVLTQAGSCGLAVRTPGGHFPAQRGSVIEGRQYSRRLASIQPHQHVIGGHLGQAVPGSLHPHIHSSPGHHRLARPLLPRRALPPAPEAGCAGISIVPVSITCPETTRHPAPPAAPPDLLTERRSPTLG